MAEPAGLSLRHLTKSFGALTATDDLSLEVRPGEVHAIIGPNGAGKTTLIAQIAGELTPSAGDIYLDGECVTPLAGPERSLRGIARSFQITCLCHRFSALTNVALAVQAHSGHSFRFWRAAARDVALQAAASEVLARVGLAERAQVMAGHLAHGEQRQLELAVALATRPRLLVLDEPMAGMGKEDSARMIALLKQIRGTCTIVLVEHDMDAVFALADRVSVLVYGRCIATGTPQHIRANAEVRHAYLGDDGEVTHD